MAKGRVSVVRQAPGGGLVQTGEGSTGFRMIANTMGTTAPILPALGGAASIPMPVVVRGADAVVPDGRFEADELDEAEIRRREEEEGLSTVADHAPPFSNGRPGGTTYVTKEEFQAAAGYHPPADLSSLPERFSLEVERKESGAWVVRAPGVHIGLFVADADLAKALAQAPARLADIVKLDGEVPAAGRKRKRGGMTR